MSTDILSFLWDLEVLLTEAQMIGSQISEWMRAAKSLACPYPSLSYLNLEKPQIRVYPPNWPGSREIAWDVI